MEYQSFIRLTEMKEEMYKSLDNVKKVIEQQKKLINIICMSSFKDDFKEFIEKLEEANKNYEEQVSKLEEKIGYLEEILDKLSEDESLKQIIDSLFNVIGLN